MAGNHSNLKNLGEWSSHDSSISYEENWPIQDETKKMVILLFSLTEILIKTHKINVRELFNNLFSNHDKLVDVSTWDELKTKMDDFLKDIFKEMPEEDKIVFKLENEGKQIP